MIPEPTDPAFAHLQQPDFDCRIWVVSEWIGVPHRIASDEHDDMGWWPPEATDGLSLAIESYRPLLQRALSDIVVVVPQVGRLLGGHQDHGRGATCLERGRERHAGVAGGLEDHRHRRTVGDLRAQALEIGRRRAELPRRRDELRSLVGQAGAMVGATGDVNTQPHFRDGMVDSLVADRRLSVVDGCTFRRVVTIQAFRSRGPTP